LIDIQGAWRRDGRTLDGGPWAEVSDVLWVQAGRHFCDLRALSTETVPAHMLDLPQAFSGTVKVHAGFISFHHDLDSLDRDPSHPDEGTVHRLGDAMFERGPGFEERWVMGSLPGDETAVAELRTVDRSDGPTVIARIVRVGSLALAVWGGTAPGGAQFLRRHQWKAEAASPRPGDPLRIDEAAHALGYGNPLPESWALLAPQEL
jgi:hypothetical protein